SVNGLLSTYAGQRSDLQQWLAGAEINRDDNLRLQYLAGLALNTSMEATIYSQILGYRTFPKNIFFGSDETLQRLMATIQAMAKPPIAPASGPRAMSGPTPGIATAIMPAARPTTPPIQASWPASASAPTFSMVPMAGVSWPRVSPAK